MAIKFDSVKVGDVLYDVHRYKLANVNASRQGCWEVHVKQIDTVNQRALVAWNGNAPEWKRAREVEKYRRSRPKEKQ